MALTHIRTKLSDAATYTGLYFDGRRARARPVEVVMQPEGLSLHVKSGTPCTPWTYRSIARVDDPGAQGALRLKHGYERLVVDDPAFIDSLKATAPHLGPSSLGRRLRGGLIFVMLALAMTSAFTLALPYLGKSLGHLVPPSAEQAVGEKAMRELTWRQCSTPAGQQALGRLVSRLGGAGESPPFPFQVSVVDVSDVNAVAFPGGHILLYRGLVEAAPSAEALAGVLAQEMTHSADRHPMAALVTDLPRHLVTDLLVGESPLLSSSGGFSKFLTTRSYSLPEETSADLGAVTRLQASGINPAALASFMEWLGARDPDAGSSSHYLSFDHARSRGRVAGLRAAIAPSAASVASAAMPAPDWVALKGICRQTTAPTPAPVPAR